MPTVHFKSLTQSKGLRAGLLVLAVLPGYCSAQHRDDRQSTQLPAAAKKKKPPQPQPRAVAVLEWVPSEADTKNPPTQPAGGQSKPVPVALAGAPSKDEVPKQARLIPVSIFYQGAYQDAGVYLSQPTPLALQAETLYEVEKAGDPAGTFTVHTTSRNQDAWVAYGDYKPVPPPKAVVPNVHIALGPNEDDEEGDRPVLRRRHADTGTASAPSPAGSPTATGKQSAKDTAPIGSDDPDRPTLKRHDTPAPSPSGGGSSGAPGADNAGHPAAVQGKPESQASAEPRSSDNYLNPADDASRPKIKRGTYREQDPILPPLSGNPPNLRQTVAVSDAVHSDDHPYAHAWNDEAERQRAQQGMQDLAFKQIAVWQKSLPKPTSPKATHKPPPSRKVLVPGKQPPSSQPLTHIQFAAFDLAYQDEPTYVFAAQTADSVQPQLFAAVVARPDIYGNLQVVFAAITSQAELALTPRYRLIDAVDANGDGRAELLMEARNPDGRRFVLLDVYRGVAQKVFETGLLP